MTDGTGKLDAPPASLSHLDPAQESAAMMAIVVYRSHSGVTRRYGEEIAAFVTARGVAAQAGDGFPGGHWARNLILA